MYSYSYVRKWPRLLVMLRGYLVGAETIRVNVNGYVIRLG